MSDPGPATGMLAGHDAPKRDGRAGCGTSDGRLAPRGLPHTFANLSDEPIQGIGLINPSGFEQLFAEIADYLTSTGGQPDPNVILQIKELSLTANPGPSEYSILQPRTLLWSVSPSTNSA